MQRNYSVAWNIAKSALFFGRRLRNYRATYSRSIGEIFGLNVDRIHGTLLIESLSRL